MIASITLQAAKINYLFKLLMADRLIYITAREQNTIVWTQDVDFKDLEGVYSTLSTRKAARAIGWHGSNSEARRHIFLDEPFQTQILLSLFCP